MDLDDPAARRLLSAVLDAARAAGVPAVLTSRRYDHGAVLVLAHTDPHGSLTWASNVTGAPDVLRMRIVRTAMALGAQVVEP